MLSSLRRFTVAQLPVSPHFARFAGSDALSKSVTQGQTDVITRGDGAAFKGDLRSTGGLGLGDGIETHTGKWMDGPGKTPMEWVHSKEPIECHGLTVASYGSDDPSLGAPVEYIDLRGTTKEDPATCKYTGNKFYSLDWRTPGKLSH